jgi:hypothetical protein
MTHVIYHPIAALVEERLGREHTKQYNCWDFIQDIFLAGRGIAFDPVIEHNRLRVQEVWWRSDPVPLEDVVRPYDLLVLSTRGPLADHIGVVIDKQSFAHNREKAGVCRENLQNWHQRCLQVLRVTEASPPRV